MTDSVRDIRDVLLGLHSGLVGTHLGDVCKRAADEISRLRAELAEKDKRIAELDRHRATLEYMDATGEWVTHDQIDAAWKMGMEEHRLFGTRHILGVLEKLGIVPCEKCGGTNRSLTIGPDEDGEYYEGCTCPHNGWVMEASDG